MKIVSVNFVKEAELPQRAVNTELQTLADAIGTQFAKVPVGQAVSVKVDKLGKYTRYALQKKLHRAGHTLARVSTDTKTSTIFIRKGEPKAAPAAKK